MKFNQEISQEKYYDGDNDKHFQFRIFVDIEENDPELNHVYQIFSDTSAKIQKLFVDEKIKTRIHTTEPKPNDNNFNRPTIVDNH